MDSSVIEQLPLSLYRSAQVQHLDQIAIREFNIAGSRLMTRAGRATFALIQQRYPQHTSITLLCGAGNNAGDGYIVAALAQESGYQVELYYLRNPEDLTGDALGAYQWAIRAGVAMDRYSENTLFRGDLIVDAILGTGLKDNLTGLWQHAVENCNTSSKPVVAVDIPSGLNGDSGSVMGAAIKADATISFIGLKQGLFTAEGRQMCGEIFFHSLDIPDEVYLKERPSAKLLKPDALLRQIKPRRKSAHKGDHGRLLIVGGNAQMGGAVIMAAEAAVLAGAGLVSIITDKNNRSALQARLPETIVMTVDDSTDISESIQQSDFIVAGPGIGRDRWADNLLSQVINSDRPLLLDADALYYVAKNPLHKDNWIMTPHPGEAGYLLNTNSATIQSDRFNAIAQLHQQYGGTLVLKGSGTLVCSKHGKIAVNATGNPGLAVAGSGDVLAGVIAAIAVQGYEHDLAAQLGVALHGASGDILAQQQGELGIRATDLTPQIRSLLNRKTI